MASKKETVYRARAVKCIEALPYTKIFSIQQISIKGTPDILCCINGRFVAIEFKASLTSKVDPLQIYNLEGVKKCRGYSFIMMPENHDTVLLELERISTLPAIS